MSFNPDSADQGQDHYLHPLSVIFSLVDLVKQNFIPAILGVLGAARGDLFFVGLAVLFFIPSFAFSMIRYFTLRYRIQNGELVVQEGLFFRRVRTVPVERIQNIDLVQGILHRILGLAEVRVETASGTKPEAILKVLSLEQIERLRAGVGQSSSASASQSAEDDAAFLAASDDGNVTEVTHANMANETLVTDAARQTLLKIPLWWLAQAGFASNKGFLLVGLAIGLYFQFDQYDPDDFKSFDFVSLGDLVPNGMTGIKIILGLAAIAATLLLLRLLGVGWFILRFAGYELRRAGEDFKISCGLLTRVSATIPRKRIQFISVHQSLLMRRMNLAAIRIETAGGAADDNESAMTTVSRRWFIPVIKTSKVKEMLAQLRPGMNLDQDSYNWTALSNRAGRRFVRLACLASLVIVAPAYLVAGWIGALVAALTLPAFVWYAIKRSRSVKFARTDEGVVYRSGVLMKKTSYTFFEKIQAATYEQTPFDRRWKMATLAVDTAASGPAQHAIEIGYLDAEVAQQEYQRIVQLASAE